jgi:hypothetical protein
MGKDRKPRKHTESAKHVRPVHEKCRDHVCPQCDKGFMRANSLKVHILTVHEKRSAHQHEKRSAHQCSQCTSAFGCASKLRTHVHTVHEKRKDHQCLQCTSAFGLPGNLRKHVRTVHENCRPHKCSECPAAFGRAEHLKAHVRTVHEKRRDHKGSECPAAFGKAQHLGTHVRTVHQKCRDHKCLECDAAFGEMGNLRTHMERIHDIGKYKCDYCLQKRNSSIPYDDHTQGEVQICRKCFVKTGRVMNSRDELVWRAYLEARLDPTYLLGCDQSLKSMGGCSRKRPDMLSAYPQFVLLGECDENQHSGYNGGRSCEEARLSEIYEEPAIVGNKMVVLRWNPDGYKPPGSQAKVVSLKERLEIYVALHQHLLAHPPDAMINVYYLFYSPTNQMIMNKYPVHMIYSKADVEKLPRSSSSSSSSSSCC